MSARIQCDSCHKLFDNWHERIAVEAQHEGPRTAMGGKFSALNGDYCSIFCLAHKMQAAEPEARTEMLSALDDTAPT